MTTPLDDDYLTAFSAGQQAARTPYQYDSCARCEHEWHGMGCTKYSSTIGTGTAPCNCPGIEAVA